MGLYEPGRDALDAGALPTGDLTDVAAQVKLMAALGRGIAPRVFLLADIAGELTVTEDLEEDLLG